MNPPGFQSLGGADPRLGAFQFELTDKVGHEAEDAAFLRRLQPHSCRFPEIGRRAYSRPMDEAAATIRDWMKSVLEKKDWSAFRWARDAGLAPSTVQRALKEDYGFTPSSVTLDKLARAANTPPPIMGSANQSPIANPNFLTVRYRTGAGVWQEVGDVQAFDGVYPVTEDPAYSGFPQWLERVVGDSMDLEYPDGTFVHVVDAAATGYAPRPGDQVILVRYRHDGQEVERTVKEVTRKGRGLEFWPRSTNPRWNEPVVLHGDGDQVADLHRVEIAGLVLGSYRPRRNP